MRLKRKLGWATEKKQGQRRQSLVCFPEIPLSAFLTQYSQLGEGSREASPPGVENKVQKPNLTCLQNALSTGSHQRTGYKEERAWLKTGTRLQDAQTQRGTCLNDTREAGQTFQAETQVLQMRLCLESLKYNVSGPSLEGGCQDVLLVQDVS